jgi:hypothetical protein
VRRAIFLLLVWLAGPAFGQAPARELIYGAELMTPQEREQYRKEVSQAKGAQEQARVRTQQRQRLQERAKGRGIQLRDPEGVVQPARK